MDLWGLLAALAATVAAVPSVPWIQTLDELDAARNEAFVRGDASALREVYLPGTDVLRRDRRTVRAYVRRGLEVDRVSIRLLRVEVVSRRSARVHLRVVDRLEQVRVRETGGAWRRLPRDQPTEHAIVLVRTGRGWRIASSTRLAG